MDKEKKISPQERRDRLKEIQLPDERKIVKHPDFEIAKPQKVSVIGFVLVLAICWLIIFFAWLIGRLCS